jgi:hypothetical protein
MVLARPQHPEKSRQELERLLKTVLASPERTPSPSRIRAARAETALGPENVLAILESYAQGESAHAIGKEFSISAASVMRLVRKQGLPVHDRGLAIDTVRFATELYSSGLSLQKVADRLLVPKSTVRRELLAAGAELRPPKHP